jgi:hypothetical protein
MIGSHFVEDELEGYVQSLLGQIVHLKDVSPMSWLHHSVSIPVTYKGNEHQDSNEDNRRSLSWAERLAARWEQGVHDGTDASLRSNRILAM